MHWTLLNADFRKTNVSATCKAFAQFVELCRSVSVLGGECTAIDGNKFKAMNNQNQNFTSGKIVLSISSLEENATRYLDEMARIERQDTRVNWVKAKLCRIREEVDRPSVIAHHLK